jgi:hypothetical protein
MRSAILMGSVAAVALTMPALALPDRYEQGYSCTGQGAQCTQEQMRLEDGNRFDEKGSSAAINGEGSAIDQSRDGQSQSAARETGEDDTFGDEVGESAENTADEAGDEIDEAADEAGDEIDDAADEVGDAFD